MISFIVVMVDFLSPQMTPPENIFSQWVLQQAPAQQRPYPMVSSNIIPRELAGSASGAVVFSQLFWPFAPQSSSACSRRHLGANGDGALCRNDRSAARRLDGCGLSASAFK
jgi:hypothetical protein